MRKLVVFLHTSLDGMVEGPNGSMDIGYIAYNEELENFAIRVTAEADTILWGKNTYQMMHAYWPTILDKADASDHETRHAKWIDSVEKVVCSESLAEVTWNKARLMKGDIISQLRDLKLGDGRDILVLGSPRLAKFLLSAGLVDQLKLTVSPVLLGAGLNLFDGVRADLELLESETMSTGALGLTYQVLS